MVSHTALPEISGAGYSKNCPIILGGYLTGNDGVTDVSELRPLRAYCSTPGDSDVTCGMMVSSEANS
jgi:hypothetical protein